MKNMTIRVETEADVLAVYTLLQEAFKDEPHSDQREHLLVERLRACAGFNKDLSMVAVLDGQVVGYVLLTEVVIAGSGGCTKAVALAPVAVCKAEQGHGIGSELMACAHEAALKAGYGLVVLLGDPNYYSRFGYVPAADYGIVFPFEVPSMYCMVKLLTPEAAVGVAGVVEYLPPFYE